jgi:PAS domain S-box-containing protein
MTDQLLVVEDEGLIAKNIERLLVEEGYEVIDTPPTAEEAIDTVERTEPDLVLMDIQLAGDMTGIEAAETIYQGHGIPVVYLTAHTDDETVQRAEATAPFGFLSKPIEPDDLTSTVRMVLRKKEQIDQRSDRYEQRIELSWDRYKNLVGMIPDVVFQLDSEERFKFVSSSIEQFGHSPDSLLQEPFNTLIADVDSETTEIDISEDVEKRQLRRHVAIRTGNNLSETDSVRHAEVLVSKASSEEKIGDNVIKWVGVIRDITDRWLARRELEETNRRLKRSNDQLRKFADMAAHDLKGPLRTVTSFTELIGEQYAENLPEEAREYLDRIEEGTRTMGELVDGLRQYAEVQLDQDRMDFVDLTELIDSVRRNLSTVFEEQDATLDRKDLHEVRADPVQFRRCLQNLLKNALEHGGDELKTITVRTRERAADILVSVCDDGAGLPENKFEEIFDTFTSGTSTNQDSEIRGLGLAICREIITQHGGQIWAESNKPNGTCFKFTLPKKGMVSDDIEWRTNGLVDRG